VFAYELKEQHDTTQFSLEQSASYVAWLMCALQRNEQCVRWVDRATLHASRMPPGELQARKAAMLRPLQVRALIMRGETEQAEAQALQCLQTSDCPQPAQARHWLSVAQRASGKLDEALRSAEEALLLARREGGSPFLQAVILVNRAAVELALGQAALALATVESALPAVTGGTPVAQVIEANAHLVQGQALLAVGRGQEAIEPLREAYGYWLGHDPKGVWAAEAEYWFGRAYLANGDKRGRWMVAEAQRALAKSPMPQHRRLAETSAPGR
jgi:tetratricopeptide (TPR) repeat protein